MTWSAADRAASHRKPKEQAQRPLDRLLGEDDTPADSRSFGVFAVVIISITIGLGALVVTQNKDNAHMNPAFYGGQNGTRGLAPATSVR